MLQFMLNTLDEGTQYKKEHFDSFDLFFNNKLYYNIMYPNLYI